MNFSLAVLEYYFYTTQKGIIMFDDEVGLSTLADKVNDLISKYDELSRANEELHNQVITLKAQNEAKTNQIMRLEEELNKKNSEADDVLKKIEAVLGK